MNKIAGLLKRSDLPGLFFSVEADDSELGPRMEHILKRVKKGRPRE